MELLVTDNSSKNHWESGKVDNMDDSITSSKEIITRREPEGKDYDPGSDAAEEFINDKNSVGK